LNKFIGKVKKNILTNEFSGYTMNDEIIDIGGAI